MCKKSGSKKTLHNDDDNGNDVYILSGANFGAPNRAYTNKSIELMSETFVKRKNKKDKRKTKKKDENNP